MSHAPQGPLLAGGVFSPLPSERQIVRGKGGQVWDDRGTQYIDLILGYGAVAVGHGEEEVVEAVTAQVKRGTMLPGKTREEDRLLASLRELFPHTESASLHKTGSEAVAAAIRMARCAKRRSLIVRCGFHGWHDEMIQLHRRWHDSRSPDSVPALAVPGVRQGGAPLEWLDGESTSLASILERHRGRIAAVILDPVQIRRRVQEALAEVADLCRRADVLLILDELKTCPRVALGGVQEAYGVKADLTIVGKGLSNGFPFTAVLGPKHIHELRRESRIMGTFNGELSAIAAVSATIEILRREDAPGQLAKLGGRFVNRTNQLLKEQNLQDRAEVWGDPWPCMPRILVSSVLEPRLPPRIAEHGTCVLSPHVSFVCLRHTTEQLESSAIAVATAIRELREASSDGNDR